MKMKDKILKFLDQLCCSHDYEIIRVNTDSPDNITVVLQCKKCGKIRKVEG